MDHLPSGLLPSDSNIEIFADPEHFGKCFWLSKGVVSVFSELPIMMKYDLHDEMLSDTRAIKAMRMMGILDDDRMLEQYNYCNRGRFDEVPDINASGKKTREFFDCGRRGRCPGEGKVCSSLCINGSHITHREFECMKLIGIGLTYKRITIEMGFRRETAVNSLIDRIRDKMQCHNNTEIAIKVREMGII